MPGLQKTPQTRFHSLNIEYYNITALGCFMVLFLKRPAGLNLLCSTGSLNFPVFFFNFYLTPSPTFPRSLGREAGWGGFCVFSFLYVWTG